MNGRNHSSPDWKRDTLTLLNITQCLAHIFSPLKFFWSWFQPWSLRFFLSLSFSHQDFNFHHIWFVKYQEILVSLHKYRKQTSGILAGIFLFQLDQVMYFLWTFIYVFIYFPLIYCWLYYFTKISLRSLYSNNMELTEVDH